MGKPNTHKLDRAIQHTNRMLEAVRNGEMWPLTGAERRRILAGIVGGSYKVVRGKSTARAERNMETAWTAAETRLIAELTALQAERTRIVNEHARAKAAKKSSGWW